MNENDIGRVGRPHGGTMIIYKLKSALPVSIIRTNSKRLCAASIATETFKILGPFLLNQRLNFYPKRSNFKRLTSIPVFVKSALTFSGLNFNPKS